MCICLLASHHNILVCCILVPISNVVSNGAAEEHWFLANNSYPAEKGTEQIVDDIIVEKNMLAFLSVTGCCNFLSLFRQFRRSRHLDHTASEGVG